MDSTKIKRAVILLGFCALLAFGLAGWGGDEAAPADVMAVLLPIWSVKPETARRVRQRIGASIQGAHRTMSVRLQLLLWLIPLALPGDTRLLRFPDIHANRIVFVYAGDLWTASDQGGLASRLTAHPGLERFPKFSPDGSWIAFTGQYDGHDQVYVMPSIGGEPRQLTWYPSNGGGTQVHGWTPDGKFVTFRSNREFWDRRDGRLYTVSMEGGLPAPLEMARSGAGEISPNGELIVFTPNHVEPQWWNGYRGGQAQDLYLLHRRSRETRRITSYEGTDHAPMWIGEAIYFVSDRSGTLNLHRYDLGSNEVEQLTNQSESNIRWPSSDSKRRIIFEFKGALNILNVETREESELEIQVLSDNLSNRVSVVDASRNIESVALSPSGERAVISARGDVFTLPAEKGPVRNLTRSSDSHDRLATWSPDGRMIAFVSDRTGEDQIYQVTQDHSTQPEQLTSSLQTRIYSLQWSPDAKRISFYDKDGSLYVLDAGTKELKKIFDERRYTFPEDYDQAWSPDGRYLAFSARASFLNRSIFVWDRQAGSMHRIGSAKFNEYNPAWGQNGDYLYYLSEREFNAFRSGTEWNFFTDKQTAIFALALRTDVAHPFPLESDEVALEASVDLGDGSAGLTSEPNSRMHAEDAPIDFEGLDKRVARVPVPVGNYSQLAALDQHLGVVSSPLKPLGAPRVESSTLLIFDIGERETTFIPNVGNWTISADGGKILVQHEDAYNVRSFPPEKDEKVRKLAVERLLMERVPSQEWRTIFGEAWRRFRDFFYARNMHGFDWEEIRGRYEALLPHVSHRSDLNQVIGEMVSELRVSHIFVRGGDFHRPDPAPVALLGVDFEADHSAQRYRIKRILNGHNEEPIYRSPLTEIGIDVREGDYLIEIDGVSLGSDDNPYRLLQNRNSDGIRLLVNDRPTSRGARAVIVRPVKDESNLRYLGWTEMNREYVRERSNDTVGYIHLPSMGDSGMREFIKWFYPQMRKAGLVIDVRGNTGGFISQMILERLNRERLGVMFLGAGEDYLTYPNEGFFGRMVCLIDERSASDGDVFPLRFRAAGLGPLVGRRTWGGTVGIASPEPLLDGGVVTVPMAGIGEADGSWSVENQGTVPDIEVENDAQSAFNGRDLQLERAVEEVLRAIELDPLQPVRRMPDPVR